MVRQVRPQRWAGILAGLSVDALDCLQVNLAALADLHHGPGTHLQLGAVLDFRPRYGAALPTVVPDTTIALTHAEASMGLRTRARWSGLDGPALRRILTPGDYLYVVADAFDLPWVTPYAGRTHTDHSLLVQPSDGGYLVVDAYHIDTPTGQARPGCWLLTAEQLDRAATAGATAVRLVPADRPPSGAPTPRVEPPDPDTVTGYVTAYRDHPDRQSALAQLAVETWTLARSRRLHARLRGDGEARAHAAEFERVSGQIYLALRRVDQGRQEPPGWPAQLTTVLTAERRLAAVARMAAPGNGPGTARGRNVDEVRGVVLGVIAEVLGADPDAIAAAGSLADFPRFTSFRMIDMVERIERTFGIEFPPPDLVPENLQQVDRLVDLVMRRAATRVESGGTDACAVA